VRRLPSTFRIDDLVDVCPGIPRPTIDRALADLKSAGEIECSGKGRYAIWKKLGT
jgi:DNA-binding IclR family transcriptional regulator